MGTVNVLEAARINGVGRVHLASTVWVYNGAPDERTSDETSPFYLDGAGHIYTSTKMAAEMLCHNYHSLYGVPFTVCATASPTARACARSCSSQSFSRRHSRESR